MRLPSMEGTILLAQTALPAELRHLHHIKSGGDIRSSILKFQRGWLEDRPSHCSRPMVLQRLQHIEEGGGDVLGLRSSSFVIQRE